MGVVVDGRDDRVEEGFDDVGLIVAGLDDGVDVGLDVVG